MGKTFDTVIFCDLDGTITTTETFVKALKILCKEEDLVEWFGKFHRKEIPLRVCTETLFSLVPSERYALVEEYAKTVQIRDGFAEFLDTAEELGIPVVVISGGIRRMQEVMLAPYLDRIEALYSCHLNLDGPYMSFESDYASEHENMDKERIMRMYSYKRSICIGDGITDMRMVSHCDEVFARDMLAEHLREIGKPFHPWETFHDIAAVLKG